MTGAAHPTDTLQGETTNPLAGGAAAPASGQFLRSLEGLRAIACCGIIITHVAFQTGADTGELWNRMMARTDFFVPVFFALSGFLLWRRHSNDFTSLTTRSARHRLAGYYVKRVGRILPAYLVLVVAVLLVFPVAERPGWVAVLANLGLAQIYVPGGLVGGLTHLWSLCVEMAFYLVLPLVAWLVWKLAGTAGGEGSTAWRCVVIALAGAVSFCWAFLPWFAEAPGPGELNPHVMPPAFAAWFAVGMLSAELEGALTRARAATATPPAQRAASAAERITTIVARYRWVFWCIALGALTVAASDGPEGLTHATPAEFARRTLYGTVFAAALITPYAIAPRSKFMESAVMQTLGRWSYSIFLWHMAILSLVFPLLGIPLFSGHTFLVLITTFALTVPVAALSFALVEEPSRRAIQRWWAGR